MSTERVQIRTARPDDAAALLEIYAPYVTDTAITFEYEIPTQAEFASRIEKTLEKYPYFVAEADGRPVGYAYAGAFKERAAYDWSVETSIYVRRDLKCMGVGRRLYDALEAALMAQGITNVNACIAYTGEPDAHLTQDSVRTWATGWWVASTGAAGNLTGGTTWSGWKSTSVRTPARRLCCGRSGKLRTCKRSGQKNAGHAKACPAFFGVEKASCQIVSSARL